MHTTLDPLAGEFLADPYPFLARQREDAPVAYCEAVDMWLITRHADVEHVFLNPDVFSAAIAQMPLMPLCDEAAGILKQGLNNVPVLSNFDPPGHTRIRRRLAKTFSTKRMRMLAPIIEERFAGLLKGFADRGKGDLAMELCYPLPALTMFAMIGFPDEDSDQIKEWCADKLVVNWGRPEKEHQIHAAETMVAFWEYCTRFVQLRRQEPADDMTTDLIQGEDMSEPLTDQEIASIVFALSFAGHETTTNLAANCIRVISERGMWEELRDEPDMIPGVIEETLRFDSSVVAWRRIATEDTSVGSVPIPKGAKLMLSMAAAGRDPEKFPDPDTFDPSRKNAEDQLSFGKGIHFCLGAHLARIEIDIVLRQLIEHLGRIEIVNDVPLEFSPNISFRGPVSLPARWTPFGR